MLQKAKEMVEKVIQLGSSLLQTLEKKDAEELARLQNTHEHNILELLASVKQDALEEAEKKSGIPGNHQTFSSDSQRLLSDLT